MTVIRRDDRPAMERYVRQEYAHVIAAQTPENAAVFVANVVDAGLVLKRASQWSAYVDACRAGSQDDILKHLRAGTWRARETCGTSTGYHAVHMAARYGCERVLRYLVEEAKVDVDMPSTFGRTALHYAFRGAIEVDDELGAATVAYLTRSLRQRAASDEEFVRMLDLGDNAGVTPLEAAVSRTPSEYWARLPAVNRLRVAWLLRHVPDTLPSKKRVLGECPDMAAYCALTHGDRSAPPTSLSSSSPSSSSSSSSSSHVAPLPAVGRPQEDDGVCCICMNEMADTIVEPCGHCVVCRKCSVGLRSTASARTCVRCRAPIVAIDE